VRVGVTERSRSDWDFRRSGWLDLWAFAGICSSLNQGLVPVAKGIGSNSLTSPGALHYVGPCRPQRSPGGGTSALRSGGILVLNGTPVIRSVLSSRTR